MNILVTGGAGFIGSNLSTTLIDAGHTVLCLDNLYTGRRSNITHLLKNPRFRFIKKDILKPLVLPRVDQVYNLACPASPPHYQKDPIYTVKVNTIGVLNVLEYARRCRARVVQASTSEIYGDPLEHPQRESYRGNVNTIGPRSCYDEGKRVAEAICSDYNRFRGLDVRIARIFNTYGPRMQPDDGRVVSNFIVQALQGKSLTVYGKGMQTRSFCYIDDLVAGLMALMAGRKSIEPVNLGNPQEYTVLEFAKLIQRITGVQKRIIYKPLPVDDPRQRKPDITRARKQLGWKPSTSLKQGLKPTIDYFRQVLTLYTK